MINLRDGALGYTTTPSIIAFVTHVRCRATANLISTCTSLRARVCTRACACECVCVCSVALYILFKMFHSKQSIKIGRMRERSQEEAIKRNWSALIAGLPAWQC